MNSVFLANSTQPPTGHTLVLFIAQQPDIIDDLQTETVQVHIIRSWLIRLQFREHRVNKLNLISCFELAKTVGENNFHVVSRCGGERFENKQEGNVKCLM
jgi:hypothetical protein